MNLHGLKLFLETAREGSITAAAKKLRISQPAVSSQVKRFEQELGIALFERNGRVSTLTDVGSELAERAERLFSMEEDIDTFIDDHLLARRGKLRIVATYLPANFLIPTWAANFKSEYKNADLIITTTNSKGAFQQLKKYEADIAIYGGGVAEQPDDVEWEEVIEDELWFVVSPDHPLANKEVSLQEMMNQPFVMREEGSSTRERLISLCKTFDVPPPKVALQFNGLNEAIRSVMTGFGANFISSLVVEDYVKRQELARVYVQGIQLKNKIAICTRKNERPSRLMKEFVRICKQDSFLKKDD